MSDNVKLIIINLPQLSNSKWVGFSKGQPRINNGNHIIHGFGYLAFEIGKTWIFIISSTVKVPFSAVVF